jgi:DNA-3-methyladenine glycosylase
VEAYLGVRDRASHAFGGRRTARNGSMYGKPGLAYVYFTYGMHYCFNVVCGEEGTPAAVLVRALEPMEGLEEMFRRRGRTARTPRELCSGPGRLTKAMGIDRDLDGVDLCVGTGVFIQAPLGRRPSLIPGPRVGIGDCGSWTARALRWHPRGSPWASRPRLG